MKRWRLVAAGGCILAASAWAGRATTSASRIYRLVQPWGRIQTLSEEQRQKIFIIHKRSLAQIKEIQKQERREILSLLSDQQKIELVEAEERADVNRKQKAAEGDEPTTAATQSAEDLEGHGQTAP